MLIKLTKEVENYFIESSRLLSFNPLAKAAGLAKAEEGWPSFL